MNHFAIFLIKDIIKREHRRANAFREEIKKYEGGKLYVKNKKGKIFFAEYDGKSQHWITKDRNRIYQLARKEYIKRSIIISEKICDILEESVDKITAAFELHNPDALVSKFSTLESDMIILDPVTCAWKTEKYSHNPIHPEALKYMTTNGVRMRSKSERIIGNILEKYGIIYRYEEAVEICGKIYYPDFTILCDDGTIIIWEHFGLMEDEGYKFKAFNKICDYRKLGFKQYKNLICTWEDDLESMENIEDIVNRIILKRKVW